MYPSGKKYVFKKCKNNGFITMFTDKTGFFEEEFQLLKKIICHIA